MKAILTTNLFDETSLYFKKSGTEIDVIQTDLERNELNESTYEWYKVPQVMVKYPYASFTPLSGEVQLIYHECKIDAFRVRIN